MEPVNRCLVAALLLLGATVPADAAEQSSPIEFTVSMERPSSHYLHVEMRCDRLSGETLDLKLPVWSPGYYWIMDYARNVSGFRALDATGKALSWEKATKSCWRIHTRGATTVTVAYDVYAFGRAVCESRLDDSRAFISS